MRFTTNIFLCLVCFLDFFIYIYFLLCRICKRSAIDECNFMFFTNFVSKFFFRFFTVRNVLQRDDWVINIFLSYIIYRLLPFVVRCIFILRIRLNADQIQWKGRTVNLVYRLLIFIYNSAAFPNTFRIIKNNFF